MLHHLGSLLSLPRSSGLADLALELATWRWQLLPWDCHMVDRKRTLELGGFALRFNLFQFDDFALDLATPWPAGRLSTRAARASCTARDQA